MTNPPLSSAARDAIKARCEAATPGPWVVHDRLAGRRTLNVVESAAYEDEDPGICAGHSSAWPLDDTDAQFIAHARTDIPALLAEGDALRAEVATLTARLQAAGEQETEGPWVAQPEGDVIDSDNPMGGEYVEWWVVKSNDLTYDTLTLRTEPEARAVASALNKLALTPRVPAPEVATNEQP